MSQTFAGERPQRAGVDGLTEIVGWARIPERSTAESEAVRDAAAHSMDAARDWSLRPDADPRDRIIAIFAHDLRGLLNALTVNSELFLRQQGDAAAGSARTMRLTIERMAQLTTSLLDSVRLGAGRLELRCRPLDARALIQEAVEIFRPLAGSKSLALSLAVPDTPLPVTADHERMFQVVSNLVSNAIEFSPVRGRVSIQGTKSGEDVQIAVADDGPGIPVLDLARVFESFYQTRTTASRGLGLGLYIARAIVDAHGGKLWVSSQLGVGSTFYVRIPGAPSEQPTGSQAATT